MKRKLILLALIVTLALCIGISACNDEPQTYTVTFMNGSEVFDTQTVESGGKASKPSTDPVKTNYSFDNWYKELKADGTGSGEAFSFTTPITGNLTLYAAFREDQPIQSITTFISSDLGIYPQKFYEGEKITPSGYGMEAYDFGDWDAFVFEKDTSGFSLPEKYAYRNIKPLAEEIEKYYFCTYYYYFDEELMLEYECYDYGDYIYLNVYPDNYDEGFDVLYYVYGQIIIADCYNIETAGQYFILSGGGNQEMVYRIDYFKPLDGELTVNDAFIDEYCYDGIAFIFPNKQILKNDYLFADIYIDSNDYDSLPAKAGRALGLSVYNKIGYNAVYYYDNYTKVEIELKNTELLNAESIAKYKSYMDNYFLNIYLDEAFEVASWEDYCYSIGGWNTDFNVECLFDTDEDGNKDLRYSFIVVDGVIKEIVYYLYDGSDWLEYAIGYNSATGEYSAYTWENTVLEGDLIPSAQFDIYKKLNRTFGITLIYIKPMKLDTEYIVEESCRFSFTVEEDGVYLFSGDEGFNSVSLYNDIALTDEMYSFSNDIRMDTGISFVLLAGKTYYFKVNNPVNPYSFKVTKRAGLEGAVILAEPYEVKITEDCLIQAFTFTPDADGRYNFDGTDVNQEKVFWFVLCIGITLDIDTREGQYPFNFNRDCIAGTTYYIIVGGEIGAEYTFTVTKV